MRFGVIADTHYTLTNPSSRIDNYAEALSNKFYQVAELCKTKKVDALLILGDLFHSKSRVRWIEFTMLYDLLRRIPVRKIVIPGNHCLFGSNFYSYKSQPIGALAKSEVIEILDGSLILEGDTRVQLCGVKFSYFPSVNDFVFNKEEGCYLLVMSHLMLLPKPPAFETNFLLFDEILDSNKTNFDLVINGHVHSSDDVISRNGKTVMNIGSLSRGSLRMDELERVVNFVVLDIKGREYKIERMPLNIKPFSEIFDVQKRVAEKKESADFNAFIEGIQSESSKFESFDLAELVVSMQEFKQQPLELQTIIQKYLSGESVLS